MKTYASRWLHILLPTFLAMIFLVAGGCGGRGEQAGATSSEVTAQRPDATSVALEQSNYKSLDSNESLESLRVKRQQDPRVVNFDPLFFWWDGFPDRLREIAIQTGPQSNMHFGDYAGPEACRECHKKNFDQWSEHPHRWMNAKATSESIRADFSGTQSITYLGGKATFYRDDGDFRMKLVRADAELVYEVRETIGSRFFQYFIGRLVQGPFSGEHVYCTTNHVLPFGYWLDRKQWVPVVHVGSERPDGQRDDPFAPPSNPTPGVDFTPYAANCNMCHTTFPLADDLTRKPQQLAKHAPERLHWNMGKHFRQNHSELWESDQQPWQTTDQQIDFFPEALMVYEAAEHAVTHGISCEACHLGCKEHVDNPKEVKPDFHPHSPLLFVQTTTGTLESGRTHQNLNWTCARCHVGERPQFAAGMSTWNSVEYSDAMLGSCYSELKCIDCHSPHQATGKQWARSAQLDDASCIRCHKQFETEAAISSHTHHDASSVGSRCMNCHMPKINEGINSMVRTHTIFSPTNVAMIEANHPNACNLCHTDQPIDWTLQHLGKWYGAFFSANSIATAYPERDLAVAAGWMKSDYEPVRLAAASAACDVEDKSLLPELIEMLDDPYLINRQFTLAKLEKMLGIHFSQYGYQFYMTPQERAEPLRLLREAMLSDAR